MSYFLRTAALMLLVLSRAPVAAAAPTTLPTGETSRGQSQVCAKQFKHSLSGLYNIATTQTGDIVQPYNDFDILYSKSHQAQLELETICKSTALLTQASTTFAGVKSIDRAKAKIDHKLKGNVAKITDLARATITAKDVATLMAVYENLALETEIVQVKNRFKQPKASGYRDLNLLVRLPKTKIIAEVQLHLAAIAEVKSGHEHSLYERVQLIERTAANEQRQLSDIEKQQIYQIGQTSKQLYQEAWQPYITTHLSAA